jgi:hypothetical protein
MAVEDDLFGIEATASWTLTAARATAMLTPSLFVPLGEPAALREVARATTEIDSEQLVPHIPTDAAQLEEAHLPQFLRTLESVGDRRLAFTFAGRDKPLQKQTRLAGLRQLLAARPGSWILGVDALVGTDAVAHGAGWAGVGASSSRRWPDRPGENRFPLRSTDGLPGLFVRDLLEFRSPGTYADWYADSPSPFCRTCNRQLDRFDATDTERQAIVKHNLHAIRDFALELVAEPLADRQAWLARQRAEALHRHQQLTREAASTADRTLQNLCSLDRRGTDQRARQHL